MKNLNNFKSILANEIGEFLRYKRALGKHYKSAEDYFRLLDRYLLKQGVKKLENITQETINGFLASRPYAPCVYNAKINLLHQLFNWLVLHEIFTISPVNAQKRVKKKSKQPFIFNQDQIKKLLEETAKLSSRQERFVHRAETYRLAFLLMYGLGLRVGEVARLCRKDVDSDRQLLIVRKTKFSKSRLVPYGPKLKEEINTYMKLNDDLCKALQPNHPLLSFHFNKQRPIFQKSISRCFHSLIPQLDLTIPSGIQYPRAHHLRHSFAVGTLLRWYKQGINPSDQLIYLSTFMGHVDVSSTEVYLTVTTELMQQANNRFKNFVSPILKEVLP